MTTKVLWLWKLAIVRLALYSMVTQIATFKMCTDQVGWESMNFGQKRDVILDMFSAEGMLLIAFIDKTEKSLETGTGLPPDMTTHEETTVTRKTITDTPSDAPATASTELTTSKTITAATQPPPKET